MPAIGDLARCSRGQLGLITGREEVRYADGATATAWVGVHLEGDMVGKPWSSRSPDVVGTMEDAITAWEVGKAIEHVRKIP